MAFEGMLAQPDRVPRSRRRAALAAAIVGHGALLVFGVVASFWRVDELSPPMLVITFQPPRTPPPAPDPRTGGGSVARREKPAVNKSRVRPPERPAASTVAPPSAVAEDKATGNDPGNQEATGPSGNGLGKGQGVGTGDLPGPGGCPPGLDCGPPTTPILPPDVGAKRCVSCPVPHLPPAFLSVAGSAWALAKICVDQNGAVTAVDVLKGIAPIADAEIVRRVQGWRFSPMTVAGRPVPFCYRSRFVFSVR